MGRMSAAPTLPSPHIRAHDLRWLLVAAMVAGCGSAPAPAEAAGALPDREVRIAADSPKRRSLQVETVQPATERTIATLPALVVPDEDHTVRVASPVTGRIVTLDVHAGDRVRAGQPLAQIRSADAVQATSELAKARAAWMASDAALARMTDLYEHKVSAARDLEQARSDEAQTRAEYDRTRVRARQLGLAATSVSDVYVLRAPVDGVVVERTASPGAEVRSDNGQPLFAISALDAVWLAVSVPQRDLALVHRGTRLRFRSEAVPGQAFEARINFVSDALDAVSRTATARAVLANPGELLRVQTSGEAQLLVTEHSDAVMVPTRALVTRGTGTVVFVQVAPDRFLRRAVTVRDDDGTMATLASGLAAGDRVVTTGSLLLAAEADRAP
jgi:cobalt-zinc-cadmium efflux system membrane fusion protein